MRGTQAPRQRGTATSTSARHAAALLIAILLITVAGAFTPSNGFFVVFETPADGGTVSGTVNFNVSTNQSANVRNVTFLHNDSGTFSSFRIVENASSGQQFFNTTNDTSTMLSDGNVWIRATAVNDSDFVNTTEIPITVDNVNPAITPRKPDDNTVVQGTLFVNATWTDGESVMYNMTNASGLEDRVGTLNDSFDSNVLPDGAYDIGYNATDAAGNVATNYSFVNITIDNDAPIITSAEPGEGVTVSGNVSIGYIATELGTTVAGKQYWWEQSSNLVNDVRDANETYQTVGNLSDGSYALNFNASDESGNEATETNAVTVDNTPPMIVPRSPTDGTNISGAFDITATWSDATSSVTNVNYAIFRASDGSSETKGALNETTFNSTSLSLDSVDYLIQYTANDSVGNVNRTENITIKVDNTDPKPTIHLPREGWGGDTTPKLNVTGTDNLFGVTAWNYSLDNGSTTSSFTPNTTISISGEYMHNITVWAEDYAGNVNSTSRNFSLDTTTPTGVVDVNLSPTNFTNLKEFSPITPRILQGTAIELNWSVFNQSWVSDTPSGVERFDVWIRNRSFDYATHDFETNWSASGNASGFGWYNITKETHPTNTTSLNLASGKQYEFYVATVDKAGNANLSKVSNVTLDNEPPQFGRTSDRNDVSPFNWTNQTNVTLEATIADVAGIENSTINLTMENLTGQYNVPVSLSPGTNGSASYTVTTQNKQTFLENLTTYNVTVGAADFFSHANLSMNWSFSTDFNIPAWVNVTRIDSHTASYAGFLRDNHTAQVECSDPSPESGVDRVEARLSGSVHTVNRTNEVANLTLTGNGNNTYVLPCIDEAGNVNATQNVTVAIDSRAPDLTSSSPSTGATDQNTSFTMTLNFEDEDWNSSAGSGINTSASRVELDLDTGQGGSLSLGSWTNSSVTADLSSLDEDEPYEVVGWFVDNVGHNASFSVGFRTTANASSGGGGGGGSSNTSSSTQQTQQTQQTTESIDIQGVSGSATILVPGWVEDTFSVENDGGILQTGIDLSWSTDGPVKAAFSTSTLDLASGNEESVDVNLSVDGDASPGTYTGTIKAESDEGQSASATVDVTVKARAVKLTVSGPEAVDVNRTKSTDATFTVTNEGTIDAGNVSFAITADNVTASISPGFATLPVDGSQEVDAVVNASDVPVGVYNASLLANASESGVISGFEVKVQPATREEQEAVKERLQQLEREFNASLERLNTSNGTDIDAIRSKFQRARTAVREGDYARAAQISDSIQRDMGSDGVLTGLPVLPSGPLFPLIAGVLAVLLVGGGVVFVHHRFGGPDDLRAYFEGDVEGYTFEPETLSEKVERHVSLFIEHVGEFIEHVGERLHPPQKHLDEFASVVSQATSSGGAATDTQRRSRPSGEPERMGVEVEDV